jgi:hypothetical protein
MKKILFVGILHFACVGAVSAQSVPSNAPGDVLIPGSNAWLLHTPDDGRTTMYIAPYVGSDWNWGVASEFYNDGSVLFKGRMRVGSAQPTTQTDYKLAVAGKIVAQSIYVTSPGTWADFVFAPNYKLMPLPEMEAYLRLNKHLPYIPSAKEVEAKGYNVAEMDANLLRTVEELALQVIELRKQVEQLKTVKIAN